MSNLENRLRDAFRADAQTIPAGLPFESPTLWQPSRERQPQQRRVLVPLAAAAALALIVAGAVAGPKLWREDSHAATGLAAGYPGGRFPAAAMPKFLFAVVVLSTANHTLKTRVEMVSTSTGRVTGSIAPPEPGQYFSAIARYGPSHFIAEVSSINACKTWFDAIWVNKSGQLVLTEDDTPVAGRPAYGDETDAGGLAVSPGAKVIAYALNPCQTNGNGLLTVLRPDFRKTTQTTWHYTFPANPETLSLTTDGRVLGLVSNPSGSGATYASSDRNAVWTLRTTGPGGSLAKSYRRVVKPPNGFESAVLSPTGAVTFAVTPVPRFGPAKEEIVAYRTATGKRIGLIHEFATNDFEAGPSISLDQSGRYALISDWQGPSKTLHRRHSAEGIDLATGKVFTIPGSTAARAKSIAW